MLSWVREHRFLSVVGVSLLIKLWLTSDLATVPLSAGHDMSNFLEHGKSIALGQWFGPYDSLTLIKGPTFPIFLALVREFGISFPLAHQLLYAVACYVTFVALRPLMGGWVARSLGFIVLFFNPDTFDTLSTLTDRALLSGSLTLLTFFCALALTLRRDRPARTLWGWSIGLGCALSAFWLNREEGIWIVPGLAIVLLPFFVRCARELRVRSFGSAAILAAPVALWALAIFAVRTTNAIAYGWPTVVELQSKEFISAYTSLERIAHPTADRRFPVPRAALATAYKISPAAAELRPEFDGPRGAGWRDASCSNFQACGDIAGGWFMWALRQGADIAGHYRTGSDARAYFTKLSNEIDRACDSGRIACEAKRNSLAPPVRLSDLPLLAWNFRAGAVRMATWASFSQQPIFALTTSEVLARDYLLVANSQAIQDGRDAYDGWLVAPTAADIEVVRDGQVVHDTSISFTSSADVVAAVAARGYRTGAAFARFEILTTCSSGCSLRITDARGAATTIPLSDRVLDFSSAKVVYHLDNAYYASSSETATFTLKHQVQAAIAFPYERFIDWITVASIVLFSLELVPLRAFLGNDRAIASAPILVSGAALLAILTIVQTFSFPGFTSQYFEPLHPLLLAFISIVLAGIRNIGHIDRPRLAIGAATFVLLASSFFHPDAGDLAVLPAPADSAPIAPSAVPVSAPHDVSTVCASEEPDAAATARGSLDAVETRPRELEISGWAIDHARTLPALAACVVIDGKRVMHARTTYGTDRPDVAKALASPAVESSGFAIAVPTESLGAGTHRIEIVVRSDDRTWSRLSKAYEIHRH